MDPARQQRFAELWDRRGTLGNAEVEEIYRLVWSVLARYHPPELASLPGEHEDYLQDFFTQKILLGSSGVARGQTRDTGVLFLAYRNFLRDCLRSLSRQEKNRVHKNANEGDDDGDDLQNLADSQEECGSHAVAGPGLLSDYGHTPESLAAGAVNFIAEQEPWARVYLAIHQCPDSGKSEPLFALATKYGIASYHNKAKDLGITGGKKNKPIAEYGKTIIGRWLVKMTGESFSSEHMDFYLLAFNFLCAAALNWAEENPA